MQIPVTCRNDCVLRACKRSAEELICQSAVTTETEAENISVTVHTFKEKFRRQAKVLLSELGKAYELTWGVLRWLLILRIYRLLPRHMLAADAPHTLFQSRSVIEQLPYTHCHLTVLKMPVGDRRERRVQHDQRGRPGSDTAGHHDVNSLKAR